MKKSNQNTSPVSIQPYEVMFKKVLNIRSQSLETMAFVFYRN